MFYQTRRKLIGWLFSGRKLTKYPALATLRKGNNNWRLLTTIPIFGVALFYKKETAYCDLGQFSYFPNYKTTEDAYHWLKYYYQHPDMALVEEAVKIILNKFYDLSYQNEEPQMLQGMLTGLFQAHEDLVQYWIMNFEPLIANDNEAKNIFYRAIRQSGSKYGKEYLQNLKNTIPDSEELDRLNEICKLPIIDLRETDFLDIKNCVPYFLTLQGMYSISGNEQIIYHIGDKVVSGYKRDTLTEELNVEKFFIGYKARHSLAIMSIWHDKVKEIVHNHVVPLLDGEAKTIFVKE